MKYEELAKTKRFQELLNQVPENERSKVEQALQEMFKDFQTNILQPLENLTKK